MKIQPGDVLVMLIPTTIVFCVGMFIFEGWRRTNPEYVIKLAEQEAKEQELKNIEKEKLKIEIEKAKIRGIEAARKEASDKNKLEK